MSQLQRPDDTESGQTVKKNGRNKNIVKSGVGGGMGGGGGGARSGGWGFVNGFQKRATLQLRWH